MSNAEQHLSEEEVKELANADYSDVEAAAEQYMKEVKEPEEAARLEEAVEDFQDIIQSEQDFLKFVEDETNLEFDIEYREKIFRFKIRMVEAGDDLSFIQADASNFIELTVDERKAIRKQMKGMRLTEKELDIVESVNSRNRKEAVKNSYNAITQLITTFTVSPNLTKEEWLRFPFNFRVYISNEILDRLGLNFGETINLFHGNG